MSSGQFASQLRPHEELGRPLPETLAPELHFLLAEAARCMGLELCPELLEAPQLQALRDRPAAALLQVPHSRVPSHTPQAGSGGAGGGAAGGGGGGRTKAGWRRSALLLLRPGLMAEMRPAEVQAVLAAALAPMCLPGGGGWRLDLLQQGRGGDGGGSSGGGSSAQPSSPSKAAAGAQGPPSPAHAATGYTGGGGSSGGVAGASDGGVRLSVADAVTASNLGDLLPSALLRHLPRQQQVKWERLHTPLRQLCAASQGCGDRVALLVVQQLGPVLRAIFKTATGLPDALCPEGPDLEAQARAYLAHPPGDLNGGGMGGNATGGIGGGIGGGGGGEGDVAMAALMRMAALCQWHDSGQYRELLSRSGTTLRRLVDVRPT